MADKVTDYVCVPAVCMKTSGEFWIDCYLSYDHLLELRNGNLL